MKVLVLGARSKNYDGWHNQLVEEAKAIGWDCTYERVFGASTKSIVDLARGANMLIWCHAHQHFPKGDPIAMLRRIEDAGTVTIGINQDIYWGLQRERRIGKDPWWTCQYVYTADGGARDWASKGVNHYWSPPAVGERNLGRVKPNGRYRIVFVGGYVRHIHGNHRAQLLSWAKRRWRGDFYWYGNTIRNRIYGEDLSAVVSYADVTLGDAAPAPYYWSDRVVRMMARGAVLAHPRVEGMKEQGFTDDSVVLFDWYKFDELGSKLDSLSDRQREQLRDSAVSIVEDRHLWRHRLRMFAANAGLG